jgi:hypothetical protein
LDLSGWWQLIDEEAAMNATVANVLMREAAKAKTETHPLAFIALFCAVGILGSLVMASLGINLSAGF